MKIEHIGICVSAPIQMGKWYRDNLGFQILRTSGTDTEGVVFLLDSEGKTVLEFGRLSEIPPLDVRSFLPVQLHIAVECAEPIREAKRLVAAGAELVGESPRNAYQGEKILVRDPWGMTIQLLNRKEKLPQEVS
jgi:hypothetical protein